MPVNRISSIKELSPSLFKSNSSHSLYRQSVHRILRKIKYGRIILTDDHGSIEFGNANSPNAITAYIQINNPNTYRLIITDGVIGSAEAYMSGNWSTPNLTSLLRLMTRNMDTLQTLNSKKRLFKNFFLHTFRRLHSNSLSGSKKNISAHYDLGNDFFKLFLDETMMYSSAAIEAPSGKVNCGPEEKVNPESELRKRIEEANQESGKKKRIEIVSRGNESRK